MNHLFYRTLFLLILTIFSLKIFALSEDEKSKLMQLVPDYRPSEKVLEPTSTPSATSEAQNNLENKTSSISQTKTSDNDKKQQEELRQFKEKARQNILAIEQNPNITKKEKGPMIDILRKIQNYTMEDFLKVKKLIHQQQIKMGIEDPGQSE